MADWVKKGDVVEIRYTGTFQDGTVFDTTEGKENFTFEAGSPDIIQGVSEGVLEMMVGDIKHIALEPGQGYGETDEQLVVTVPRDTLPEDVKVDDIYYDSANKDNMWQVKELTDEQAVLDGNHPLAGKTLLFEIELLSVS